MVVREIRVLHGAVVNIRRQDHARDGGNQPARVIEAGRRNLFSGESHLRGTLQFPIAAGKQLAGAFAGGSRVRDRLRTALAVHLPFAQFERLSILRAGQAQADIAALGAGELDFWLRPFKGGDVLPFFSIDRNLDRRFQRTVDPGKSHLVESGNRSQVDGNPLVLLTSTLPGTDETLASQDIYERIVLVEEHLVHGEIIRGALEMKPERIIRAGNGNRKLPRMDDERIHRPLGAGVSQCLPGAVLPLSFHRQDRVPRRIPVRCNQDPVDFGRESMEKEFQVDHRTGTNDPSVVLVGEVCPIQEGERFSVLECFHPHRGTIRIQSVREQLCRLVVVGGGRMPCRTQ